MKTTLSSLNFGFLYPKDEQARRFKSRAINPLKQRKFIPVDDKAQEHWDLNNM